MRSWRAQGVAIEGKSSCFLIQHVCHGGELAMVQFFLYTLCLEYQCWEWPNCHWGTGAVT